MFSIFVKSKVFTKHYSSQWTKSNFSLKLSYCCGATDNAIGVSLEARTEKFSLFSKSAKGVCAPHGERQRASQGSSDGERQAACRGAPERNRLKVTRSRLALVRSSLALQLLLMAAHRVLLDVVQRPRSRAPFGGLNGEFAREQIREAAAWRELRSASAYASARSTLRSTLTDEVRPAQRRRAHRTSFAPETASPKRNEHDQSPTKIQQNQRNRPLSRR